MFAIFALIFVSSGMTTRHFALAPAGERSALAGPPTQAGAPIETAAEAPHVRNGHAYVGEGLVRLRQASARKAVAVRPTARGGAPACLDVELGGRSFALALAARANERRGPAGDRLSRAPTRFAARDPPRLG